MIAQFSRSTASALLVSCCSVLVALGQGVGTGFGHTAVGQSAPRVVGVPASITRVDCRHDVTAALNTWISSVRNGSTLVFPERACYDVEGTLYVYDRRNLTFDGSGGPPGTGATFEAKTNGIKAAPPNDPFFTRLAPWPQRRSQFCIRGGSGITLENLVIRGAADQAHVGVHAGHSYPEFQGQYGAVFYGVNGGAVLNSMIVDTYSDSVGVHAFNPASPVATPSSHIRVEGDVMERSDRDGPSVYDGRYITITHNVISDTWGPDVDLEPVAPRWQVYDVTVSYNSLGPSAHWTISAAGGSSINSDLTISHNTGRNAPIFICIGSMASKPPIRSHITIIDNVSHATAKRVTPDMLLRGLTDLVVEGNFQPTYGASGQVASGVGLELEEVGSHQISNNAFPRVGGGPVRSLL